MNENENNQQVYGTELEENGKACREVFSNALSILGKAMSEIVKSVDATNGLSTIIQNLTDSLQCVVVETFPTSENLHQILYDSLIKECETAGRMGWCFHGIEGVGDELSVLFFRKMKKNIDDGISTLESVDSYIAKQFTKEIIDDVSVKTKKCCLKKTKKNFKRQ